MKDLMQLEVGQPVTIRFIANRPDEFLVVLKVDDLAKLYPIALGWHHDEDGDVLHDWYTADGVSTAKQSYILEAYQPEPAPKEDATLKTVYVVRMTAGETTQDHAVPEGDQNPEGAILYFEEVKKTAPKVPGLVVKAELFALTFIKTWEQE